MASHARLSASGAKRWMSCTPSVALEENYPNSTSIFAEEGTFAHELSELYLSLEYGYIDKKQFNKQYKELQKNEFYNVELRDYVEGYVNNVVEFVNDAKSKCNDVIVLLEQRLDFSTWVEEGFGTGDVVVISDGTLHIIDLKYGKGVQVSAIDNPQLRLYALGAYSEFEMLYDVDNVKTTIIQPRLDSIASDEITIEDLLSWSNEVKEKATLAYAGEGEYVSGEHCTFCKARYECRKRAEDNIELAKRYDFAPKDTLEDYEISDILSFADKVEKWLKDVQAFALQQAENGSKYPGYKLVEGRSNRKYSDEDKVVEKLKQEGYEEAILYEKKLLSLGNMEKVVGKKKFSSILGDLIIKPSGKPTLVLESDKRAEINSVSSAVSDFS